jgi:hypothetical protein
MRGIVAVLMCVLMFDVMICSAIAATYIKVSDEKIGIVETIEYGQELTVQEIEHEINGIENDLVRIESAKQPFLVRLAKYKEMLAQCEALGIKKPEPIKKPITEPEHTL